MKTIILIAVASTTLAVLSGCSRSEANVTAPEPTPASVYKAGRGLQFSPTATKIVGLTTGEVASRDVGSAKGAAAIPAEALLRTVKGDFVFVSNGGWFLRTPVKVGANGEGYFEVIEGLYEGDTIVTKGARALWLAELQAVNGGVGCADGH